MYKILLSKLIQNKKIVLFIFFLLIFSFFFIKPILYPEHRCGSNYTIIENYPFNQNNEYEFLFDKKNFNYLVIDDNCNAVKGKIPRNIFDNYFIYQYSTIINNTPKEIKNLSEIINIAENLIKKPFDDIENDNLESSIKSLVDKINTIKEVRSLNNILEAYTDLYDTVVNTDYNTITSYSTIQYKMNKFYFTLLNEADYKLLLKLIMEDKWYNILLYDYNNEGLNLRLTNKLFFKIPIDFVYDLY